jgi:hypothetical protein
MFLGIFYEGTFPVESISNQINKKFQKMHHQNL